MISKMNKLSFLIYHKEYETFLEKLRELGVVRATNYIYLNPLVTILTAALFINERITPIALVGAAMILYGMWRAEKS